MSITMNPATDIMTLDERLKDAKQITRERRASDAVSGLKLKRDDFPDYTDEEVAKEFAMFQRYDLDQSGFITPQNLLDVLIAMDVHDASIEMVSHIIEEVAILTGHDNDGKLSFRDYMHAIRYDKSAAAHNEALDAAAEVRLSQADASETLDLTEPATESETGAAEAEAEAETEAKAEAPAPDVRARRGSMSALNALAASRIKAFQQVVTEASARDKLSAFRAKPVEMSGPMVNSDEMHKETLRNKVKAFEVAANYKGKVELKKTWRQVGGHGNYAPGKKIVLAGQPAGVAPKKKLSDLP